MAWTFGFCIKIAESGTDLDARGLAQDEVKDGVRDRMRLRFYGFDRE